MLNGNWNSSSQVNAYLYYIYIGAAAANDDDAWSCSLQKSCAAID